METSFTAGTECKERVTGDAAQKMPWDGTYAARVMDAVIDSGVVFEEAGSIPKPAGVPGDMSMPAGTLMSYEEYMRITTEGRGKGVRTEQCDPLAMDFSVFNTDSAQIVRECAGTVYGYVRVSTDHQDYARQIEAMDRLGVLRENIFGDKKSGKDFEREEFKRLMGIIRPGDLLVVVALDRFGRNMTEIKEQWSWITQYRQTSIVVIDQPVLNTKLGMHGLGTFISELILAVFSLMAELERGLINKRMGDGLRKVKLEGKKLGRRCKPIPQGFWGLKRSFLCGETSQNKAAKVLSVDPKTFGKWVKRTGDARDEDEWRILMAVIEEREKAERIRRAQIEYGGRPQGQTVGEEDAKSGTDETEGSVDIHGKELETSVGGETGRHCAGAQRKKERRG